jgi:hypothetical protein
MYSYIHFGASAAASPAHSRSEKVRPDPVADVGGRRAIPLVPPFGFGQSPVWGRRSYWNYLDFVVVILNLFDPLLPNNTQVITCLRIGRCLRPLRLLVRPARAHARPARPAHACACVRAAHRAQTNAHARANKHTHARANKHTRACAQTHKRARAQVRDKRMVRAFQSVLKALPEVGSTLLVGSATSPSALPTGRPACERSIVMPASPSSVRRARSSGAARRDLLRRLFGRRHADVQGHGPPFCAHLSPSRRVVWSPSVFSG